jgi:hypothetical protein
VCVSIFLLMRSQVLFEGLASGGVIFWTSHMRVRLFNNNNRKIYMEYICLWKKMRHAYTQTFSVSLGKILWKLCTTHVYVVFVILCVMFEWIRTFYIFHIVRIIAYKFYVILKGFFQMIYSRFYLSKCFIWGKNWNLN